MKNGIKKKESKYCVEILLGIMIVFQLIIFFWYGNQKEGFLCDELYSYEGANSYYSYKVVYFDDWYDAWHTKDDFYEIVSVQDGEQFAYDSVWWQCFQPKGHLPVYYLLLHTVCSFFPNVFSKWLGIGLNMVIFVLVQCVLFVFGKKILKSKWKALLPVLFYGISAGAISTVIFVRGYMLFALLVTISAFLTYELMNAQNTKWKQLFLLYVVTFFGFSTHYYFMVWAFFMAIFFGVVELFQRKVKTIISYAVAMFGALATEELLVGKCLRVVFSDITNGGRASTALTSSNAATGDIHILSLWVYFVEMGQKVFNGKRGLLYIAIVIMIFIFFKIFRAKPMANVDKDIEERKEGIISVGFILVLICYFVLIAVISPRYAYRYCICIFPLMFLMGVYLLCKICPKEFPKRMSYLMIGIWVILSLFITSKKSYVDGLLKGHNQIVETLENYSDLDSVFFYKEDASLSGKAGQLYRDMFFWLDDSEIYLTTYSSFRGAVLNNYENNRILVWINSADDVELLINNFVKKTKYESYELVTETETSKIFVCEK